MTPLFLAFLSWFGAFFRSRHDLGLELVALRQQVGVLKRKNPRPKLSRRDRLFWLGLRRCGQNGRGRSWSSSQRLLWAGIAPGSAGTGASVSRRRPGRPKITPEVRNLIRSLAEENPTWGAPWIHGELLKLGFEIAESTVSRTWLKGSHLPDSGQRWLTFLENHREAIAAMDFFTVPTATFRVLYGFFLISHGRRNILHFNVTEHPTCAWIVQQLREAFPEDRAPQYLILDRDVKFSGEVATMLEYLGSELIRTAYRSPWQNGVAERWVGSCRRELLDHVIVLNESHLRRLVRDYLEYYHDDRIHDALRKETPTARVVERRPDATAKVVGVPQVGGSHHRSRRSSSVSSR